MRIIITKKIKLLLQSRQKKIFGTWEVNINFYQLTLLYFVDVGF